MKTLPFLLLLLLLLFSCDSENLYHTLTVINGDGSGEYKLGEAVPLKAAAPPRAGESFFQWIGDTTYLQSTRAPSTVLTMPFRDVQIEAVYKELPTYRLEVINGEGSGNYIAGTSVPIKAVVPSSDRQFARWSGDTIYVADTEAFTSFVVMPEANIRVTANFEINRDISFNRDVFPLMQTSCAKSSCHGKGEFEPILTNYTEISRNAADIKRVVLDGSMPYDRRFSSYEINLIVRWIDAGAKNN